jgi:hypothetical protein
MTYILVHNTVYKLRLLLDQRMGMVMDMDENHIDFELQLGHGLWIWI